jgi:hypothetical protein
VDVEILAAVVASSALTTAAAAIGATYRQWRDRKSDRPRAQSAVEALRVELEKVRALEGELLASIDAHDAELKTHPEEADK